MISLEADAQAAKDNLCAHLHIACGETFDMKVVQFTVKYFLNAHKRTNSIARIRALTEYVANKRFNHADPVKMLQTAWNRTRQNRVA